MCFNFKGFTNSFLVVGIHARQFKIACSVLKLFLKGIKILEPVYFRRAGRNS